MGHVQKRLASTAAKLAHVSVSTLKQFPPKEAVVARVSKTHSSKEPTFFHAETWGALQPPPPAAAPLVQAAALRRAAKAPTTITILGTTIAARGGRSGDDPQPFRIGWGPVSGDELLPWSRGE